MGSHTTEGHHRFTTNKEKKNKHDERQEPKISEYGTNGLAGILNRLNVKPTRHKKHHEGHKNKPINHEPTQDNAKPETKTIHPIDKSDLS